MSGKLDGPADHIPVKVRPLYYLYCFSKPGSANHLNISGIHDGTPAMEVVVGNVAAIISKVDSDIMAPLIQADLAVDPDALIRLALDHNRVIGTIMAQAPVLPVRFGSIFSSPDTLFNYLHHGQSAISTFLEETNDQQEWSVKIFLDIGKSTRQIAEDDPVFKNRWRQLAPKPGLRYLQEKRFWSDVQKESNIRADECVRQFLQFSNQLLGNHQLLKKGESNQDGSSVLWHGAFLLNLHQHLILTNYAIELNGKSAGTGLNMMVSGPWPPYSFCPSLEEIA